MTEHYIEDLDKDDEKLVRQGLQVQKDAMRELEIVNRMTKQFLEGNISLETIEAGIENMALMSGYESMAVNEL